MTVCPKCGSDRLVQVGQGRVLCGNCGNAHEPDPTETATDPQRPWAGLRRDPDNPNEPLLIGEDLLKIRAQRAEDQGDEKPPAGPDPPFWDEPDRSAEA